MATYYNAPDVIVKLVKLKYANAKISDDEVIDISQYVVEDSLDIDYIYNTDKEIGDVNSTSCRFELYNFPDNINIQEYYVEISDMFFGVVVNIQHDLLNLTTKILGFDLIYRLETIYLSKTRFLDILQSGSVSDSFMYISIREIIALAYGFDSLSISVSAINNLFRLHNIDDTKLSNDYFDIHLLNLPVPIKIDMTKFSAEITVKTLFVSLLEMLGANCKMIGRVFHIKHLMPYSQTSYSSTKYIRDASDIEKIEAFLYNQNLQLNTWFNINNNRIKLLDVMVDESTCFIDDVFIVNENNEVLHSKFGDLRTHYNLPKNSTNVYIIKDNVIFNSLDMDRSISTIESYEYWIRLLNYCRLNMNKYRSGKLLTGEFQSISPDIIQKSELSKSNMMSSVKDDYSMHVSEISFSGNKLVNISARSNMLKLYEGSSINTSVLDTTSNILTGLTHKSRKKLLDEYYHNLYDDFILNVNIGDSIDLHLESIDPYSFIGTYYNIAINEVSEQDITFSIIQIPNRNDAYECSVDLYNKLNSSRYGEYFDKNQTGSSAYRVNINLVREASYRVIGIFNLDIPITIQPGTGAFGGDANFDSNLEYIVPTIYDWINTKFYQALPEDFRHNLHNVRCIKYLKNSSKTRGRVNLFTGSPLGIFDVNQIFGNYSILVTYNANNYNLINCYNEKITALANMDLTNTIFRMYHTNNSVDGLELSFKTYDGTIAWDTGGRDVGYVFGCRSIGYVNSNKQPIPITSDNIPTTLKFKIYAVL